MVEGQRRRQRNWVQAADGLPVASEGDMPIENTSESSDPLVGRLGAEASGAQRGHHA
jgi:hypothetical protein